MYMAIVFTFLFFCVCLFNPRSTIEKRQILPFKLVYVYTTYIEYIDYNLIWRSVSFIRWLLMIKSLARGILINRWVDFLLDCCARMYGIQ